MRCVAGVDARFNESEREGEFGQYFARDEVRRIESVQYFQRGLVRFRNPI